MKRQTKFCLDLFTLMVMWPAFLGRVSDLYIHRSPRFLDLILLLSSGLLAGIALFGMRSMILGEEQTETNPVSGPSELKNT